MNILIGLLTAIHVVVALIVIVLVLMQKSSEQGVGAAFGSGVTETMFGGGTATALVRMTIWCASILLATTLILAVLHSHRRSTGGGSLMRRAMEQAPAAPATVPETPATAPAPAPVVPETPAPAKTP